MPSGNLGFDPFLGLRDTSISAKAGFNNPSVLKNFSQSFDFKEQLGHKNFLAKLEEQKNFKVNNLKGLFYQSGDKLEVATQKANSYYNRISNSSSSEELNGIFDELSQVRDKASRNNRLYAKGEGEGLTADLIRTTGQFLGSLAAGAEGMFGVKLKGGALETKEKANKALYQQNPDLQTFDLPTLSLGEDDFFNNIKGHINEVKTNQFGKNFISQFKTSGEIKDYFNNALDSKTPYNALSDVKTSYLNNEFKTKGTDFYREGDEGEKFRQDILKNLNPKTTGRGDDVRKRYLNYDIENESLNSVKSELFSQLNEVIKQAVKTPDGKIVKDDQKIDDLRKAINAISLRQKENKKIYGVEEFEDFGDRLSTRGRSGDTVGAFRQAIMPLGSKISNAFGWSDESSELLTARAAYQPKTVGFDAKGNPILSNKAFYTKADGSLGFNGGAILELGVQQVGQMLPTIAISEFTGGLVKGLSALEGTTVGKAASSVSKGYNYLNRGSVLGKELKLADRLSTMVNVFATTYPMMEEEEKKYGGNYKTRARWKALIEGGTEGIGFPDVGSLKIRPMESSLLGDAVRVSSKSVKDLAFSDRLGMMWNTSKQFGKLALKQNVSEALEEEMSLIGNALYEGWNQEDFKGREKTRANGEALMETFAESFVGGLLYSGGTTAVGTRSWANKNNLQALSDWNAANNPELMKAKIKELYSASKLTEEQASAGIARVDLMANTLKSAFGITELKDRKARLDDKDEQYKYFTSIVEAQDLMQVNFDSLSDEDKKIFKAEQVRQYSLKSTSKRINEIKDKLAELKVSEDSIPEEKRESYESEVEKLNDELFKLKNTRATFLNKRELSSKQIEFLKSKNLYTEPTSEFNKEDFDKILNDINTDLVKQKKKVDKYVNLSDAEKQAILDQSYDEQIEAVQKVTSPFVLNQTLDELSAILDDYEKNGRDFEELDKANAERLKDAFAKRFDELVYQRNEQGFNAVEQQLQDFNFSAISDTNDIFSIEESLLFLNNNKDFISQDLFDEHSEKLNKEFVNVISNLQNLSKEEQVDWLANYLDKIADYNPLVPYSVDLVNRLLASGASQENPDFKVTFTDEDLTEARNKMLEIRGKRRAEKRANVKPDDLTEDQIIESEQFKEEAEELSNQSEEVDEAGKSAATDIISENYKKHKDISIKNAGENWRDFFFERMNNLIYPYFPKLSSTTTLLKKAALDLKNGLITLDQFNNAVNNALNSIKTTAASKDPNSREFKNLKEQKDVLEAYKTYINKYYNEDLPEGFQVNTTAETPVPSQPTEPSPLRDSFPKTEVGNKMYEEAVAQAESRVARLLQLSSPLSSMAIEVGEEGIRTDKVTLREVAALNQLASEPNAKIRIQTRAQYVKQFLSQKYPDYTVAQLNNAFNTILDTFNSLKDTWNTLDEDQKMEALNPVFEIMGKDFFNRLTLTWLSTNTNGLLDPRPLMTPVVGEDLFIFEEYPVSFAFRPANLENKRVDEELNKFGVTPTQTKEALSSEFTAKESVVKYIISNPTKYFDFDFEVTAGVIPQEDSVPVLLAKVPDFENVSKDDLAISVDVKSPLFGKNFIFHPGRAYLNVGGNPTLLDNIKMDPEEVVALTEMIFADDESMSSLSLYPGFNDSAKVFMEYLMNRVNQSGKKSLFFLVNPKTGQKGEPAILVRKKTKDGWKTLTREETIQELSNSYYKADKNLLEKNAVVPKFFMTEDGEVSYVEQDYVSFLMDTHTVPTVNGQPQVLRNKRILLDSSQVLQTTKTPLAKVQPKPAIAPQPTTPTTVVENQPVATSTNTSQESTSDFPKHPETPLFTRDQYLILGNLNVSEAYFGPNPKVDFTHSVFIPSRAESIETLKKFGASAENISKLENISDQEFQDYILSLLSNPVERFLLISEDKTFIDVSAVLVKSRKGQVLKVQFKDGTSLVLGTTDASSGKYSIEYANGSKVREVGYEEKNKPAEKPTNVTSPPVIQLGSSEPLKVSEPVAPVAPDYDENEKMVTYFEEGDVVEQPKSEETTVVQEQPVSVNPAAAYVEVNDVEESKESEEKCDVAPKRRNTPIDTSSTKKKTSSRLQDLRNRTIAPDKL